MEILVKMVENTVKRLEAMEYEEIYQEVEEALDISVTTSINKEYRGCRIAITLGGPNIFINTNNSQVEGYWGLDSFSSPLNSQTANTIDDIICDMWEQ